MKLAKYQKSINMRIQKTEFADLLINNGKCAKCSRFVDSSVRARKVEFEKVTKLFCSSFCAKQYLINVPKIIEYGRFDIYNKFKISLYEYKLLTKECAICGFNTTVDLHHIIPLSQGGKDEIYNYIGLCPNHHQLLHRNKVRNLVELREHYENYERNKNLQKWNYMRDSLLDEIIDVFKFSLEKIDQINNLIKKHKKYYSEHKIVNNLSLFKSILKEINEIELSLENKEYNFRRLHNILSTPIYTYLNTTEKGLPFHNKIINTT